MNCDSYLRFRKEFVLMPLFMPTWLHGSRFEVESWFGAFLRLSAPQGTSSCRCLMDLILLSNCFAGYPLVFVLTYCVCVSDEASLNASVFSNSGNMSSQQQQLAVVNLRHKLEESHELLEEVFKLMLSRPVSKAGLMTWIAAGIDNEPVICRFCSLRFLTHLNICRANG